MNCVKGDSKIVIIPIYKIIVCSNERKYSRRKLVALSKSIEKNGILQPIIVRDVSNYEYEIVSGERRLRAAVMAGITEVPCIILHCTQRQSEIYRFVENIQHEHNDHFHKAEILFDIMNNFGFTVSQAAEQLGISERTVNEYIEILEFTNDERKIINEHDLDFSHIVEIIKIKDKVKRKKFLVRVTRDKLSLKEISQLVFEIINGGEIRHTCNFVLKDIRIFGNTVNNAVDMLKNSGISTFVEQKENDRYIEYRIKIAKIK